MGRSGGLQSFLGLGFLVLILLSPKVLKSHQQLLLERREVIEYYMGSLGSKPGKSKHYFCVVSVGQIVVPWPHLTAEEDGRCRLPGAQKDGGW